MSVTQKVTLYNNKFTVPPVINAVQNDTDRQVEAYFGDFTLQVGMTGKLSFIRSDGTHYEVSATLNTGANTATAELDQALTQAGVTQAQLKITDSGNVGSTFTFMIKVQPDVAGISQQQDGYSAEELAQGIADNASAIENIENVELLKKADQDGYYEDLTSGTSLAVLGTPTKESVPYLFRRSASIGVRESDKIIGGTVGWNELVQNGDFSNGTTGWANSSGSSWSVSSGVLSFQATARYQNAYQTVRKNNSDVTGSGKFLFRFTAKSYSATGTLMTFRKFTELPSTYTDFSITLSATETTYIKIIDATNLVRIMILLQDNNSSGFGTINLSNVYIVNLTQLLGSTIADYIYGLEQNTAGSGIAMLKSWGFFTKDYYAYDSGSLQSVKTSAHKTVGKSLYPFKSSGYYDTNGIKYTFNKDGSVTITGTASTNAYNNYISWQKVKDTPLKGLGGKALAFNGGTSNVRLTIAYRIDSSDSGTTKTDEGTGNTITIPSDEYEVYIALRVASGVSVNRTIYPMIRFADADATFEPYWSKSYPLDSDLELRGIPKLDGSNKLYYDGDTYASDGTVVRKYGSVNLGSLDWNYNSTYNAFSSLSINTSAKGASDNTAANMVCQQYRAVKLSDITSGTDNLLVAINVYGNVWIKDTNYNNKDTFKTAMNGVYLVYELATPTTENANQFHDPQICSPYGTEEYVDTRDVPVPVGHETEYYADPVAEIERVAVQVPIPPTVAGSYRLTCTVVGGVPTYSWTS